MDTKNQTSASTRSKTRWIMIFGMAVTGLWICILAGASLARQFFPLSDGSYYKSAWIWIPAVLINIFIIAGTLIKPRFNFKNLGIWISHAGVVVLSVTAGIYAFTNQSGYCISENIDGRWSEIKTFFTDTDKMVDLPETIKILNARREIYPASSVIKDNICILDIAGKQTALSFNNPVTIDRYRICQGHWQMKGNEPQIITFQVATRPGIKLIWTSFVMIAIGLLYAFYVKPLIGNKKRDPKLPVLLLLALSLLFTQGCKRAQDKTIFDKPTTGFLDKLDKHLLDKITTQYEGRICPLDTLSRRQLSLITDRQRNSLSPSSAYLELYFNAGKYLRQPIIAVRSKKLAGFISEKYLIESDGIAPAMLVGTDGLKELFDSKRLTNEDLISAGDIPSLESIWKDIESDSRLRPAISRLSLRYSAYIASGVLRLMPADNIWEDTSEILKQGSNDTIVKLAEAWRNRDAAEVNNRLAEMLELQRPYASTLPKVEIFYNRVPQDVIELAGFALAGFTVLLGICGFRQASACGTVLFGLTTIFSIAAFGVRWVVSGRGWYFPPLASQYEAMTGSVMLVALACVAVEKFKPRGIITLVSCLYAAVMLVTVLFAGRLFPSAGDSSLGAVSGILFSKIMSLHVAVIVIGHGFAGMTMILSLMYLAGMFIYPPVASRPAGAQHALEVIDRANLILIKLACVCMVIGTMLGAYWADFAWSRWWGWDPKETWALITALIYLIIIHLRLVLGDRWAGGVSATACLIGGSAMLFNWFVVNYVFVGLHGYN